jgi:hypothetical protein
MLLHETNGAARPATAAVRKNWRRDQDGGVGLSVTGAGEAERAVLSFMPAD